MHFLIGITPKPDSLIRKSRRHAIQYWLSKIKDKLQIFIAANVLVNLRYNLVWFLSQYSTALWSQYRDIFAANFCGQFCRYLQLTLRYNLVWFLSQYCTAFWSQYRDIFAPNFCGQFCRYLQLTLHIVTQLIQLVEDKFYPPFVCKWRHFWKGNLYWFCRQLLKTFCSSSCADKVENTSEIHR